MNSFALEKLKTLIEINSRINSNYSDKNALLVYILESAMRLVECESSSFLLVDRSKGLLHFAVALGPKGKEAKSISVERKSIAGWVAENKKHAIIDNVVNDPRFSSSVQNITGYVAVTMIAVPVCSKNECIGVIELINKTGGRCFNEDDLEILLMLCSQAAVAYENASMYQSACEKISALQNNLSNRTEYHPFISKSEVITDLMKEIADIAKTNTSVLITGESGVGKELFAEQLHLKSDRSSKPFIRVNCAALAPSLLESELFGHVKGAFTDATETRKGRFEMADSGTIFLDEIGEIPMGLQSKLLRVLQTKEFEKVGSSETISVDVRVVTATNRDLEKMVKEGTFRSDLYYRLNVVPIHIPPLRSRKDDIESLSDFFLEKFSRETKKNFTGFSDAAMKMLLNYYWPGNVRELENSIERACVLGKAPIINVSDLRISCEAAGSDPGIDNKLVVGKITDECVSVNDADRTLKTAMNRFKKMYVHRILEETSWNQTKTGKILGIQRTYVSRLLNELHIRDEK
jgi:transcriptional regulator with GAF, ATPase, and Fis domain